MLPSPDGERARVKFLPAEQILGLKCPPALQGHMLPIGMKFYTTLRNGKTKFLSDPIAVRPPGQEFKGKCKICDKFAGHEAVDCMEDFQVDGRPAKTFRQLYEIYKVVDCHGMYIK